MKIQRYAPNLIVKTTANGTEYPYADMRESIDGNFFKHSDIMPLLNPWKDAEKEKPLSGRECLLKVINWEKDLIFLTGSMDMYGYFIINTNAAYSKRDLKSFERVIAWMYIPKNEEE